MLGQPVDLEVGMDLAQRVGDRDVALRVAEADRRGDVERATAPGKRASVGPAVHGGGGGVAHPSRAHGSCRTKSRIARLTRTGQRAFGAWPPPTISSRGAPSSAASRSATASATIRSSVPWMIRDGQRTRRTNGVARPSRGSFGPHAAGGQRYWPYSSVTSVSGSVS